MCNQIPLVRTSSDNSTEVARTDKEIRRLETDWNRLNDAAAFPNIFMTFDWFWAWNQRFARETRSPSREPNVLVFKRGETVTGIAPLIRRTASRFGLAVRKIEFVESESAYNDLVAGDDADTHTSALIGYLADTRDQWDLVDLRSLRETGNTVASLKNALTGRNLAYRILPEKSCPYLTLDAPWEVMLSRLSTSTRHRLRNQQNRLDRMQAEGLRTRIIEDPQTEPGLVQKLIELESQKRIDGKLVPPFSARYPEIFEYLFKRLGPQRWITVFLMELGDVPVAWNLIFRAGSKLWCYHRAFNRAFSRLSPGTMLDTALIDYGFSHGFDEYDFLYGNESYKLQWNTGVHERFRLVIWSKRLLSKARAFIYLDLKTGIYRLFRRAE